MEIPRLLGHEMIEARSHLRPELMVIWRWFFDLSETRAYKKLAIPEQTQHFANGVLQRGVGWRTIVEVERLSPQQLQAWSVLSGVAFDIWHVVAIAMMDEIYVKAANSPPVPAMPATKGNLLDFFKTFGMKKPP